MNEWDFSELLSGSGDSPVGTNFSMESTGIFLHLGENIITLDELSNDVIISVKEVSFVESNHESRSIGVWAIVHHGQQTSLVVTHFKVLVRLSHEVGSEVLSTVDASAFDSEAG